MRGLRDCDPIQKLEFQLPPLQPIIRYYDEFSDTYRSIHEPALVDAWHIRFDGSPLTVDFTCFDESLHLVLKHWCAFTICTFCVTTAVIRAEALKAIPSEDIIELLGVEPNGMVSFWKKLWSQGMVTSRTADSLKSLLRFLCAFNLCGWNRDWIPFIGQL